MVKVATPPANVALLPYINVTVPVGITDADATVAVYVTDCPIVEGFSDEVSVTVVGARFTTWLSTEEVLPEKLALPPYTAVMDLAPALNIATRILATPFASFAVPSVAVPFMNVTVPVGVPDARRPWRSRSPPARYMEGFSDEVSAIAVGT